MFPTHIDVIHNVMHNTHMAASHNNYFSTIDQERNVPLVTDFPNRIVASFKYGSYAYQTVGALYYKKITTQGDIYAIMRVS